MPDPDRGTKKVSGSAIKEIQQMGMGKAIKQYTSGGGSPEFRTAVERYYSPQRLKKASSESKPSKSMETDTPKQPVKMPESAPAAAARKVNPVGASVLGKKNAEQVSKVTKPIGNVGSAIAGQRAVNAQSIGKALSGASKKLGLNNPFKPRKR